MPTLIASGAPGTRPTWTSSAKDMVTTALGPSRVWVTMGFGIINEIYWPETGQPQVRDLGFIVAGPSGWFEVKRVNRYAFAMPERWVPLPQVTHKGDGYELYLEVVPDPTRDVVLISYRLSGKDLKLYPLLAPHLGNNGEHNNARAGDDLAAWRGAAALCLISDCGFARTSAGYVGASDGWQDFSRNGQMTWQYSDALDGNVALMGELNANEGRLALGLSSTIAGARTNARTSLSEGYGYLREKFAQQWDEWAETITIPDASPEVQRAAYLSAIVLRTHDDRTFPGSMVASLSVPWGNSSDSLGGYHLVWARDCVEAALALVGVGRSEGVRKIMSYLVAVQNADGSWNQNWFPDGRPFWTGIQLDEVGFPVILAAKLAEQNWLDGIGGIEGMVRRAAGFLVGHGPISPQDRWEENSGISPFTIGIEIVALIAAAEFLSGEEREFVLSLADCWNERIEDWTYVAGGPLAERFEVQGYYVRIGPAAVSGGLCGRVNIANRWGESLPAIELVGMEYLYLVRLGLRSPDDRRILDTFKITEDVLKVETPSGIAYHRYNEDGYGEHADGSPYDGNGIGRAWPLLTGERGHFELQRGNDPMPYLEMMTRMTGPTGLIPEQVWDAPAIPKRLLEPGKPTGSAMPLVWAHAEFIKLLCARQQKRPLELLRCVETHLQDNAARGRTRTASWHWRTDTPFDVLPAERDLLIEMDKPFVLHMGFDGWQTIEDRPSAPLAFGRHGVRLSRAELAGRSVLDFTRFFVDEAKWEGRDYSIKVGF
jgi:glucoamylase